MGTKRAPDEVSLNGQVVLSHLTQTEKEVWVIAQLTARIEAAQELSSEPAARLREADGTEYISLADAQRIVRRMVIPHV